MSKIIQFPLTQDASAQRKALEWVEETYIKAGLSADEAAAAVEEFRPYLEQFSVRRESRMDWSPNVDLPADQREAIAEAHTRCVEALFEQHRDELVSALHIIAGLIGRQHHRS